MDAASFVCFWAEISGNLGPEFSISGSKVQAQGPLKTKSWSKLVKLSRTWSLGQVGHKWSSDELRIIRAISHLNNLFMASVN